ncbi:MAG: SGNH/GDSL hydrolase family protein, partial [Pseudomonadota bacterium]|nr:SGNH/GDSL hydrolase family protein [Pseudomonadota bacterium]
MRRRLAAAGLGSAIALAGVAAAEAWQRAHELGSMQVHFDPPGIKYVFTEGGEDRGRGWREDRVPPPKKPGVTRLVCLGDSVTFGVSVGARDTWCEAVRRGLGDAEAFNFGMNGYDAEQVATLLEARIAPWEPDVVVWGTYVNDVFPTYLLYGLETGDPVFVGTDVPEQARILPEPVALFLVRHSALYRRLQGAAYARSERERGPYAATPERYAAQVDRVADWSEANATPVVFLAIPPHVMADMTTCPAQFPVPALCEASGVQYQAIVGALRARGVTWVDGLTAFQASGRPHFHPERNLDPDHPNAAGHKVLGTAALPIVRTALGLPAVAPEPAPRWNPDAVNPDAAAPVGPGRNRDRAASGGASPAATGGPRGAPPGGEKPAVP